MLHLTELKDLQIKFVHSGVDANPEIRGITEDSRKVEKGFLFVAVRGTVADGTKFIEDAVKKGAAAIIAPKDYINKNIQVPVLLTENPRLALSLMAAKFYKEQPGFIAAVTGTNGKTSTVNFCRQIWALLGKKSSSIGTIGILDEKGNILNKVGSMTTPDPVNMHRQLDQMAKDGFTHLALEASSHGLDQYRLDGIKIKAAGFTSFSRDHLDYHPTMQDYLKAKLRLFNSLVEEGGGAVINADMAEYGEIEKESKRKKLKIVSYGKKGSNIKLEKLEPHANGQDITCNIEGKTYKASLDLVGDFQVSNILCAVGLAVASGESAKGIFDVLPKVKNVDGRMEKAGVYNGASVFVDYAHTPDALEKALITLRAHANGKLFVVFGCGGNRDAGKRPLMGEVASKFADEVVVTDDNPRMEDPSLIRKSILAACKPGTQEVSDRKEAIAFAVKKLKKNDMLLIAGKGHEKTQIIGDKTFEFDDVKIAKNIMGIN